MVEVVNRLDEGAMIRLNECSRRMSPKASDETDLKMERVTETSYRKHMIERVFPACSVTP